MAGGAAARCSRGGVVAQGRPVLLRVVGAPGRAVGGDDHPLWVWRSRSGRGDAALGVQLRTFQPGGVSGCRRRPDRHLHPAGREQLSVYRDCPKRGGLLHILRGHQGCEPSGGIGLRPYHDTGWPTSYPNAYTHADPNAHTHADPNAHTHADAYTNSDADPNPYVHTHTLADTDSNPDPNVHTHTLADTDSNPDPNADTHTHAYTDTLGSGTGRGGRHARAGHHPGSCRGSPTLNRCLGVCP